MFIFDLFEKKKKDRPEVKGDLAQTTQDPKVKDIIWKSYREFPQAKNDLEALAGHLSKQSDLNASQEQEIEQRKEEEARLRQQQDAIVKDLQNKEKRFQDFTAKVAQMDLTPPEQARAAQDIEQGREPAVPAARQATNVVQMPAAQAKAPAQAKTQAKTQTPAPVVSLTPQTKATVTPTQQPKATEPIDTKTGQTPPPGNDTHKTADLFNLAQIKAARDAAQKLPKAAESAIKEQTDPGTMAFQQMAQTAVDTAQKQQDQKVQMVKLQDRERNEEKFKEAFLMDRTVQLTFGPAHIRLDHDTAAKMWEIILIRHGKTDKAKQVFDAIFSDLNSFRQMKQFIDEMEPGLEIKEGTVSPATNDETTLLAYNDALTFLNYAYDHPNDPMVTTMRQDFAHKYQQRFAILPNPDKTYSMVDKQLSKRYRLPNPGFPIKEAETDYSKRRQREKDIDAGKPVAKQRQSKMTDYQKRRAQQKKELEMGEGQMKDLAIKGLSLPTPKTNFTVVKMVGPDIVPLKTYNSQEQAQLHAKNIKKKYPGMQIAVSDANGQLSMIGLGEDSWHDGQSAWSSEHDLWAREAKDFGKAAFAKAADQREQERKEFEKSIAHLPWEERMRLIRDRIEKNLDRSVKEDVNSVNYWAKLQNERRKKVNNLISELKESVDKYEIK